MADPTAWSTNLVGASPACHHHGRGKEEGGGRGERREGKRKGKKHAPPSLHPVGLPAACSSGGRAELGALAAGAGFPPVPPPIETTRAVESVLLPLPFQKQVLLPLKIMKELLVQLDS